MFQISEIVFNVLQKKVSLMNGGAILSLDRSIESIVINHFILEKTAVHGFKTDNFSPLATCFT